MADITPLANHLLRGAVVQVCHQNISSRKKTEIHQNPPNCKFGRKQYVQLKSARSAGRGMICCFPGEYANQSPKALFGCRLTGDAPQKNHVLCRDYFLSHWFRPLSWTNQYFLEYHKGFVATAQVRSIVPGSWKDIHLLGSNNSIFSLHSSCEWFPL